MKKLTGLSVSRGISIGSALLYLDNELPEVPRRDIQNTEINDELLRFNKAAEDAGLEIKALMERAKDEMSKEQSDILFAQLMMIEDVDFHDQINQKLNESLENIEWVVFDTSRSIMQRMLSSPDPYFRERALDIKDVSNRIMGKLLSVKKTSLADLDRDVILVAVDLLPSDVLVMNRNHVKGIVTEMGSRTSHTAILARAFNIPAVLGLPFASNEIKTGDMLVINANDGEVFVDPGEIDLKYWEEQRTAYLAEMERYSLYKDLPAITRDGHRVTLKANIELPEEVGSALEYGSEGIGLYRSEFLFLNPGQIADEEAQFRSYSQVMEEMGELPVTIRTVDIGGDKVLPDLYDASEKNPLLGWRAIRFSLSRPDFFKTQLRAILRSSVKGNAKIMFPLVSGMEELEDALALLDEAKAECKKKQQPYREDIEVGIMIEVPSAAMIADILAGKSDFVSIGTNDLTQYTLAADRGNEKVNDLADPLHPAILRLIKQTIEGAHSRGVKACMCGEMAGDPKMTPLLLGLGLDEFSMTASSIPLVKKVIRTVELTACHDLAKKLLRGHSYIINNAVNSAWMTKYVF